MVSQVTKVINKEGFHMRPANMFVKEMTAFQSDVHLILNCKDINAKTHDTACHLLSLLCFLTPALSSDSNLSLY